MPISELQNPNQYNTEQRRYFERTTKRTMVPADSRYLRRHIDEALRFVSPSLDDRVLEVGCGMGRHTLSLARRGVRVEGLDLSPVLLERLQAYNHGEYNIPLHCVDIDQPPPELIGAFDIVLGFFTLHHLWNLDRSFASMARLLKPGGRIAFVEPNPLNPFYYVQIAATPGMSWQGEGGITRMRPAVIRRAMQQAGLSQFKMARFGFFPPFLANHPWGAWVEGAFENVPLWRPCLPFQVFYGQRL